MGKGSIFEQIIKVNNDMTERLKIKCDLQEALIRREQSKQQIID